MGLRTWLKLPQSHQRTDLTLNPDGTLTVDTSRLTRAAAFGSRTQASLQQIPRKQVAQAVDRATIYRASVVTAKEK